MDKEYLMLREEIILSMKTVKNYNNLLYTATTALLAFAFSTSQEILFLLPFIVIFPLYFLIKREMMQVLRIGAYITIFLEEKSNIFWERRLIMYDTMFSKNKHKHIPLNAYSGLSFLCIVLSASHTNYSNFDVYCIICLSIQIILTIISIILFVIKSPNYIKMKKEYLKQWERIKNIELSKSIQKV